MKLFTFTRVAVYSVVTYEYFKNYDKAKRTGWG